MMPSTAALSVKALSKRFGGVIALDDVSLDVGPGEVRAILGKNGAGKSTLVNVLAGAIQPDTGSVSVQGAKAHITSPADALTLGVATVHQELHIVPELTVAENVMLGRWGGRWLVDHRRMAVEVAGALARLGSTLDPNRSAAQLSIADWQIIEIARALTHDVRVLVLDEPTSALSGVESHRLIRVVRGLAAQGVAVIYVSHRLDEIPAVADTITVLRDGVVVGELPAQSPARSVVELMIGHTGAQVPTPRRSRVPATDRKVALEASNIRVEGRVRGVDLRLEEGEILGLAGLLGSGASETLRAIFGIMPRHTSGVVAIGDKRFARRSPALLTRCGVAFVSNDRKREGLFPDLSVADNITMSSLRSLGSAGVISSERRRLIAADIVGRLRIQTPHIEQSIQALSGGNQQKVVIGRCLAAGAKVLLLDEPTRGVDIEAKFQIYEILRDAARRGISAIVVPSEFDEFAPLCDRAMVLRSGKVVGEFASPNLKPDLLLSVALGQSPDHAGQMGVEPNWPSNPRSPTVLVD